MNKYALRDFPENTRNRFQLEVPRVVVVWCERGVGLGFEIGALKVAPPGYISPDEWASPAGHTGTRGLDTCG